MSKNKKAVVVDDDLKTVILIEDILTRLSFQVFNAEEGKKALELVKKEIPDLLVCDLLLPGIHGLELCNTIKKDPTLTSVKIIVISAVYKESNYKLVLDCKAEAFIKKPFTVDDFEKLVEKVIGTEPIRQI
ncbi:MAG: response regulator [Acidobacteria bacterium]|jgi:CheY-like chemotaxis protein|nr:response regulator [Acidobacteriota bacterium]